MVESIITSGYLNFKNIAFKFLDSRNKKSDVDDERFTRSKVVLESDRFYLLSTDFGSGREVLESNF